MSKVLLAVGTDQELGIDVVETGFELAENKKIVGVVRTDFEPNEKGTKRVSPDIGNAIYTNNINHLVGKVLTIADATFSDREQRGAFKDLLKQTVWNWHMEENSVIHRALNSK